MKKSKILMVICLLVAGLFTLTQGVETLAQEKMPWDGTVELSTGSVAAGVGLSWGGGTLTYNGKQYKFKVDGLSVGSVGIQNAAARGKVYNLKNVADFSGNYAAVAAGVTVGGGGGAKTMKNEKGVIMDLISTNQGVEFTFGTQGVKVTLEK
ncbi:MAG: hypothetical protein AAGU11_20200 [Syntrophobacteraceae bacterium]